MGALDFAGGIVVHVSSGISALVLALLLGKTNRLQPQAHSSAQPAFYGSGRGSFVVRLVRL